MGVMCFGKILSEKRLIFPYQRNHVWPASSDYFFPTRGLSNRVDRCNSDFRSLMFVVMPVVRVDGTAIQWC